MSMTMRHATEAGWSRREAARCGARGRGDAAGGGANNLNQIDGPPISLAQGFSPRTARVLLYEQSVPCASRTARCRRPACSMHARTGRTPRHVWKRGSVSMRGWIDTAPAGGCGAHSGSSTIIRARRRPSSCAMMRASHSQRAPSSSPTKALDVRHCRRARGPSTPTSAPPRSRQCHLHPT